eukprot:scaffold6976_cov118-Isochrysis_galbana.AAC.9
MAKRLDVAQIGHIGKNIRIFSPPTNNRTNTKTYYTKAIGSQEKGMREEWERGGGVTADGKRTECVPPCRR